MDIVEWIDYGKQRGWCSAITCSTHEGIPYSEEEDKLWDEGIDPCAFVLRVWEQAL